MRDESDNGVRATAVTALGSIRNQPMRRRVIIGAGVIVGLVIATVHWVGFLLAGLVIGFTAATPKSALAWSVGTWVIATGIFLGYARWHDQLAAVTGLGEVTVIALAIPLALVLLGSAVRVVT